MPSERKTKGIEDLIGMTIQLFPDDSYIRDAEARFSYLLNNHDRAMNALKKEFDINKRNAYIASRLAKIYKSNDGLDRAIRTLKDCLELVPANKTINFQLAIILEN